MFPATIQINNLGDMQKVMSVLFPTTAVSEVTPKPASVAEAAAGQATAKAAAPAKTAKEKNPTAPAAETAAPASTAATEGNESAATDTTAGSTAAPASSEPATKSVEGGVTYAQARELVLKLAATNRDAIKAINTKHGIAKLSALLKDENDFESVIDQAKLNAVHADLSALAV